MKIDAKRWFYLFKKNVGVMIRERKKQVFESLDRESNWARRGRWQWYIFQRNYKIAITCHLFRAVRLDPTV